MNPIDITILIIILTPAIYLSKDPHGTTISKLFEENRVCSHNRNAKYKISISDEIIVRRLCSISVHAKFEISSISPVFSSHK